MVLSSSRFRTTLAARVAQESVPGSGQIGIPAPSFGSRAPQGITLEGCGSPEFQCKISKASGVQISLVKFTQVSGSYIRAPWTRSGWRGELARGQIAHRRSNGVGVDRLASAEIGAIKADISRFGLNSSK